MTDSEGSEETGPARPVDQVLVSDSPRTPSKKTWLVAVGALVVVVLGVGALVVSNGSTDSASSARPKLGVAQGGTEKFAAVASTMYQPTYELIGDLPDLGTAASVYQVQGEVTGDTVAVWADALGLARPVESEWGWTAEGDEAVLNVERQELGPTSVQYSPRFTAVGSAIEPYDPSIVATTTTTPGRTDLTTTSPPAGVPSDDEALAMAKDLLGEMGVMAGEWSFESTAGEMSAVGCAIAAEPVPEVESPCGTFDPEPQIWSRTVVATASIDGNDVDALFWNVTFGAEGKLESLSGAYGSAVALGDYPLQSTDAAFAQLSDGTAIMFDQFDYVGSPASVGSSGMGSSVTTMQSGVVGPAVEPTEPAIEPYPVTTTTYVPGAPADPSTGGAAPDTVAPDATTGTVTDAPAPTHAPDIAPAPIRISGARLTWRSTQGQVDGTLASLLVPVYLFTEDVGDLGTVVGNEPGVAVLALAPGTFDVVGTTDDTTVVTPAYPVDPGVGDTPGTSASVPGSAGDGSTSPGDPGTGGSPGSVPTTTLPPSPAGPDTPVSSSPGSSVPTTTAPE